MESTRPIRALMRGLDALAMLNMRDGATVSEVAQEIRLPRTTVYRILETLCGSGFAVRDTADERYRVTILVRGLSDGFDDETWITHSARPLLFELAREIVWPISIATLSGSVMMIRESTDHSTPLAIERYSAGVRAPLLTSATGRAYLAFCPSSERESLIDGLVGKAPRAELQRTLSDIKVQGYATAARARRLVEEVSLSIPATLPDRVLAVLTVRFASSTVPLPVAVERFLPKLRRCAARISNSFLENQAEAHVKRAPHAAA